MVSSTSGWVRAPFGHGIPDIGQPDIVEQGHGNPDLDLAGRPGQEYYPAPLPSWRSLEGKLCELHFFHFFFFLGVAPQGGAVKPKFFNNNDREKATPRQIPVEDISSLSGREVLQKVRPFAEPRPTPMHFANGFPSVV